MSDVSAPAMTSNEPAADPAAPAVLKDEGVHAPDVPVDSPLGHIAAEETEVEGPAEEIREAVPVAPAKPKPNLVARAKTANPTEGESWLETVKTIFYALLIALVIRTFLFQPFNIPSASMENTLLVGDYLFVEKFAYGYSRNSFPFRGWPLGDFFHGRLFGSRPEARRRHRVQDAEPAHHPTICRTSSSA